MDDYQRAIKWLRDTSRRQGFPLGCGSPRYFHAQAKYCLQEKWLKYSKRSIRLTKKGKLAMYQGTQLELSLERQPQWIVDPARWAQGVRDTMYNIVGLTSNDPVPGTYLNINFTQVT